VLHVTSCGHSDCLAAMLKLLLKRLLGLFLLFCITEPIVGG